VVVEPRLGKDDLKRTDANFFFSSCGTEIDVSVVHPSSASFFKLASKPLGAAQDRERRKNNMYLKRTQDKGSAFYPVILESYGAFGSRARDFIRLLSDEASTNSVYKLHGLSVTDFVLRSLAVVLQVANSVICLEASVRARRKKVE
jgi:hypothetical protein